MRPHISTRFSSVMNPKDIRALKILEAVDAGGNISQRALAERLDISLGLANSSLRQLAAAGCCIAGANRQGATRYALTPRGRAEKSRLTYRYILLSYSRFKEVQERLAGIFEEIGRDNIRRVVFWGFSEFAEVAYLSMRGTSLKMVAIVDNMNAGRPFFETVVAPPAAIATVPFDRILLTDPERKADTCCGTFARNGWEDRVMAFPLDR